MPVPPQYAHCDILVPASFPLPWQRGQVSIISMWIVLFTPLAASLKVKSTTALIQKRKFQFKVVEQAE